MATHPQQLDLFPSVGAPEGVRVINERCILRGEHDHVLVIVSGMVVAHFGTHDRLGEAHAMVSLVERGWAHQNDVARAFGCSVRTLRRNQRRFEDGGLSAVGQPRGYPKGRRRLASSTSRLVDRLKAEGQSNRQISRRLGVDEKAVRKMLRRLGWKPKEPEVAELPLGPVLGADPKLSAFRCAPQDEDGPGPPPAADPKLSAFSAASEEPVPTTMDPDPANRVLDRLFAYLGLLDDAAPFFRPGTRVPGAGVLLALPALIQSGVFQCARETYGSIGPAFYGLQTTILALLLMALLRLKRPENLKEHPPDDLGRILGLDRAPEVKTIRRKLTRLAAVGRAAAFGHALAVKRVALRGEAVGFLYVDGHVRVYHGKRVLPKTHVARMRLSMPATSDYWVNDMAGDPLFVVTAEANAGLVKMLPGILDEVRSLIGERRVTVTFDRGGYSPKLFLRLIDSGFDILTYRKGRFPKVARSRFSYGVRSRLDSPHPRPTERRGARLRAAASKRCRNDSARTTFRSARGSEAKSARGSSTVAVRSDGVVSRARDRLAMSRSANASGSFSRDAHTILT